MERSTAARLTIARLLLVAGLLVGLPSWWETVTHIGNPQYVLPATFPEGTTHAWYHALREASSDVTKMGVFLIVFFGPAWLRTRAIWWGLLILMVGYYAPFWIGEPFLAALSAPSALANAIHVAMALLAFASLIVARPAFARDQAAVLGSERA